MKTVIVIDLVGDEEAVATPKQFKPEAVKNDIRRAPSPEPELVEVSFEDTTDIMPAAYRALLGAYFRK